MAGRTSRCAALVSFRDGYFSNFISGSAARRAIFLYPNNGPGPTLVKCCATPRATYRTVWPKSWLRQLRPA